MNTQFSTLASASTDYKDLTALDMEFKAFFIKYSKDMSSKGHPQILDFRTRKEIYMELICTCLGF